MRLDCFNNTKSLALSLILGITPGGSIHTLLFLLCDLFVPHATREWAASGDKQQCLTQEGLEDSRASETQVTCYFSSWEQKRRPRQSHLNLQTVPGTVLQYSEIKTKQATKTAENIRQDRTCGRVVLSCFPVSAALSHARR